MPTSSCFWSSKNFFRRKKGARSLHVFLFRQSLSSSKIFQPQNNCYFPRNLCQTRSDHQKTSSIFIEFTTIYAHFFFNSYYVRYVRNCSVSILKIYFNIHYSMTLMDKFLWNTITKYILTLKCLINVQVNFSVLNKSPFFYTKINEKKTSTYLWFFPKYVVGRNI